MYSILKAMAEHWGDDGTQKYMSTFFFDHSMGIKTFEPCLLQSAPCPKDGFQKIRGNP